MPRPVRVVDAIAAAQRIKAVGAHRMTAARQRQRINHQIGRDCGNTHPLILGVEKAHIKIGIVGDVMGTLEKRRDFLRNLGKHRFVGQKRIGNTMHRQRIGMHLAAIGVDEQVQ